MGQKKRRLSRKAMLVVVSGMAVGMAASYNAGVAMPPPTPTPTAIYLTPAALPNESTVLPRFHPRDISCYIVIDVTPEESWISSPDGATATPTPTPTPTLIGSSGPTSLDLLREQLLAEGRFPDEVAKELK